MKTALAVTVTLLLCVGCFGQGALSDRPNLSGMWVPDKTGVRKNLSLVITQSADEIVMVETFEFEKKDFSNTTRLYPDKRGERNTFVVPGGDSAIIANSKTEWKKAKLVRKSEFDMPLLGFSVQFVVRFKTDRSGEVPSMRRAVCK